MNFRGARPLNGRIDSTFEATGQFIFQQIGRFLGLWVLRTSVEV
jgi:hypothetical protein